MLTGTFHDKVTWANHLPLAGKGLPAAVPSALVNKAVRRVFVMVFAYRPDNFIMMNDLSFIDKIHDLGRDKFWNRDMYVFHRELG